MDHLHTVTDSPVILFLVPQSKRHERALRMSPSLPDRCADIWAPVVSLGFSVNIYEEKRHKTDVHF